MYFLRVPSIPLHRSGSYTSVNLKSSGVWRCVVGWVVPWRFECLKCFIFKQSKLFSLHCFILKMKEKWSVEISESHPTTISDISEFLNLHRHLCANVQYHIHQYAALVFQAYLSWINPYPTAFPYGNGMVLHFYQQQESSTTKTVHKVINKGLKTYV